MKGHDTFEKVKYNRKCTCVYVKLNIIHYNNLNDKLFSQRKINVLKYKYLQLTKEYII